MNQHSDQDIKGDILIMADKCCGDNISEIIKKLAEYEDTGLTPSNIEHMKAKLPLRNWECEDLNSMSIFNVPVSKIIEWSKANKENRLLALPSTDYNYNMLYDRIRKALGEERYESAKKDVLDSGNQGLETMLLVAIEQLRYEAGDFDK